MSKFDNIKPIFQPIPEFTDKINAQIIDSEIEGGVHLDQLAVGRKLEIQTENTLYTLEKRPDGYYISGNPKYCPEPKKIIIQGSNWGGSMLKPGFVGRGMCLEGRFEGDTQPYNTSFIQEIKEV